MIKRKKRTAHKKKAVRKTKKRPAKRKKVARKLYQPKDPNVRAGLKTFRQLEKKIGETWAKLKKDVRRRDTRAVLADRENLKLLLGECNYMANECMRARHKLKKSGRSRR